MWRVCLCRSLSSFFFSKIEFLHNILTRKRENVCRYSLDVVAITTISCSFFKIWFYYTLFWQLSSKTDSLSLLDDDDDNDDVSYITSLAHHGVEIEIFLLENVRKL